MLELTRNDVQNLLALLNKAYPEANVVAMLSAKLAAALTCPPPPEIPAPPVTA